MSLSRRSLIRGSVIGAGGVVAGGGAGAVAAGIGAGGSSGTADATTPVEVPFHGEHQAGILTPRQTAGAFLALDLTTESKAEIADTMRTLTDRLRVLTRHRTPQQLGITAPSSDSGVLGPEIPATGLTVTVGLGSSVFDDRFGLAPQKPSKLRPMDTFENDDLDPSICHGDVLVQLCADSQDVVLHAMRDLLRSTRGALQPRWRLDAFTSPPRPSGTPRNLMGFKDGTANPDTHDARQMDDLVWTGAGEPAWARGGTYHVVRIIRMFVEFWDRVTISEQEKIIGRRRDSGAPMSGAAETDIPRYSADVGGLTTRLDAHIRLANPRTPATAANRILRRGYNYDRGIDVNGNLDMGLVFVAFQRDLDAGFVTVQKRLAGEPLVDYISPVGGGYFFALPGVRDNDDWLARELLA